VNGKVRYHAERLVIVWQNFRVISYTLKTGRMLDNRRLLRSACIEDAPEMLRVFTSGENIYSYDFGPMPSLMGDDVSAVNIARRLIDNLDDEMIRREVDCGRLLTIMEERGIQNPAFILATA
jgi:hypothetical protein